MYPRTKCLRLCLLAAICATVFGVPAGMAQDTDGILRMGKTYTLPDLYRIALKNSEQIKISEENRFISEMDRKRALSVLIPSASGFGSYRHYGVKQTYEGEDVQPDWTASAGVRVSQSFTLNGRELIALRVAEDTIVKNEHDLHAVREAYVFSVASAYYDMLKGMRDVEIGESNVKRLETHRESVSVRLELEDVPKTALFRAEAELSQARADLIAARNDLALAKASLARITGIREFFDITGPGTTGVGGLPPVRNLKTLKAKGLENRAELKAYRLEYQIAEDQVGIAKSEYWPVLTGEAGYQVSANEDSPSGMFRDNLYMEISLAMSLYDGGSRNAGLEQALAQKRQAGLALRDLEKEIALEIEQVYLESITYRGVMKSQMDQLEFARENYNAVTKQFKHGLANSVDVMDANTLLVTSQKQLSESRYDLRLSDLKLERAQGTFLDGVIGQYQ